MNEIPRGLSRYQPSRILLTAVELDLFTAVSRAGGSADAARAAAIAGTDPRATEMLLNALVALGVLAKRDGRFENARRGAVPRRGLTRRRAGGAAPQPEPLGDVVYDHRESGLATR